MWKTSICTRRGEKEMKNPWFRRSPDDWLKEVLAIHFHPQTGTRYWLERERQLGIDVRREIRTLKDLLVFGPMDEEALRNRPIEDFVPQGFLRERARLVLGDTAGTTGPPKIAVYSEEDFYEAFIEYFGYIAEKRNFPRGENWLWIGPSGPHIIGKAARLLARRMGSCDPFAIDFDPRWIKKLLPGTMGWSRYRQHLLEQSLNILKTQDVGVIFTTPPILEGLSPLIPPEIRGRIKAIHYGGTALSKQLYRRFKEREFPQALHIAGYGNTLFGVCLELEESPDYNLDYFPPGPRIVLRVVPYDQDQPPEERLQKEVPYGQKGQVVFHRLDRSGLILNMFERDWAIRIPPTKRALELGISMDGIRNPEPIIDQQDQHRLGLY